MIQPTFVTHLPKELVPLAKLSPDDPTTVEVFELCINGQEIAPGYTEQNNPIEQRERLEHQAGGEQPVVALGGPLLGEHGPDEVERRQHHHRPEQQQGRFTHPHGHRLARIRSTQRPRSL